MSQLNAEAKDRSEDRGGIEDGTNDDVRLVPVAESIRYRKRAQQAEQKVKELREQLSESQARVNELAEKSRSLETEQALTRRLVAAGAGDIETALLVAEARVKEDKEADLDGIVEQLRNEKPYLFGGTKEGDSGAAAPRTTPAKDRQITGRSSLEKAARKAATTGSRADLQEYLKLRRSFV